MQAQSTVRPQEIEIERLGNTAVVYLRRDIQSRTVEDDNGSRVEYEYEERRLCSAWFSAIEKNVADNFEQWWEKAAEAMPISQLTLDDVASAIEELAALLGEGR